MKLVILDRDGTINHEREDYIKSPEEWVPLPGALEAIARLNHAGWHVVVATNQSGIGRGLFDMVALNAMHAKMNQLLRMIVSYGTGRKADAPGFRIGGKTGSAEKPGAGGYRRTSLISTFAAAFPMDRPRYVIVAMLDEPQGTAASSYQRTAAWNAAPIVGKVVPRVGPLLGIMPDDTRDIDLTDLKPLVHRGGK